MRPFLKWAGGKTRLLPDLLSLIDDDSPGGRYYEPFLGGGALFFALKPGFATLSDTNRELIDCYLAIRDRVDEVILCLKEHRYDKIYFEEMRSMNPFTMSLPARAARMIYLNKTCFNGLYRVNGKGKFNVPFGRYKNPTICDEGNLRKASKALQHTGIECSSFETVAFTGMANYGDLVYFDPPYIPVSKTANFTSYTSSGFGMDKQEGLANIFDTLVDRGVQVLLSNADVPWVRERYVGHKFHEVKVKRVISSKGKGRSAVGEVIIKGVKRK